MSDSLSGDPLVKKSSPDKKRVLLLSGYDAGSHRYWRKQLVRMLPEFDWTVLTQPDRHFYWRMRINGLSFSQSLAGLEKQSKDHSVNNTFDLIVATSMVDLCTLRGLTPSLGQVPTILYFHENQFVYPIKNPGSNIANAQLTSIYSALCADRVVFNSDFNRSTWLEGAQALFARMPDGTDGTVVDRLAERLQVLPVPIVGDLVSLTKSRACLLSRGQPAHIVWNHRWEYDKQPQLFFDVMETLKDEGYQFRLHVMGQSFREIPECFEKAKTALWDVIDTWGYQEQTEYHRILLTSDYVVSTALHDFQGIGMLEAIQRGCLPVAPDALVYPEYVPEALRYDAGNRISPEPEVMADALLEKMRMLLGEGVSAQLLPEISRYHETSLTSKYRGLLNAVCSDVFF